MEKQILGKKINKIFVTGGAGFIGSHLVEILLEQGYQVTCYDNLSSGKETNIEKHFNNQNFNFIKADLLDVDKLTTNIKNHDLIWHLASNTDIIGSHEQPDRDLKDGIISTFNLLESMRKLSIRDIIFASSGAVYGNLCKDTSVTENAGPLLPVSTYGAGKIGSEAFISSYCSVYGLRSWIYRFGNVIGSRMTHGVIYDFILKFKSNPKNLLIRGDGKQEKNYFLVEECIEGMAFGFKQANMGINQPCDIFNLGTNTVSKVTTIAEIIKQKMNLVDATISIEGSKLAWPGDQPRVHFEVKKINKLGWKTKYTSDESVEIAVNRMLV